MQVLLIRHFAACQHVISVFFFLWRKDCHCTLEQLNNQLISNSRCHFAHCCLLSPPQHGGRHSLQAFVAQQELFVPDHQWCVQLIYSFVHAELGHMPADCETDYLRVQGDDPELEAIRQRRMQEIMAKQGGQVCHVRRSFRMQSMTAAMMLVTP